MRGGLTRIHRGKREGIGQELRVSIDPGIRRRLERLPKSVAKGAVRFALREALRPVRAQARAEVPVDTGLVRRSIKIKAQRSKSAVIFRVTIGDRDFVGDAFYGAFHEFGTEKLDARPFLKPAFDQNEAAIVAGLSKGIAAGIVRELSKGARKKPRK